MKGKSMKFNVTHSLLGALILLFSGQYVAATILECPPCLKDCPKWACDEVPDLPGRCPQLMEPGLNDKWFARVLCQKDFDSGTYRITKPGYYYLKEDIVFNPKTSRADKPALGWFAALTIEADNVVLDLNTKSIRADATYLCLGDGIKIFSDIVLNNTPFSPSADPNLLFAFTGETQFKSAHNVVIRNGTLGKVNAAGITGFDNTNVYLYDMIIKDWETYGIQLTGPDGGEIRHVCVSGREQPVIGSYERAAALLVIGLLRIKLVDPAFADQVATINDFICDLERFTACCGTEIICSSSSSESCPCPDACSSSSCSSSSSSSECETTAPCSRLCPEFPSKGIVLRGGPGCFKLEAVSVCNIKASPVELVAIQRKDTFEKLSTVGLYCWNWYDAFNQCGRFAPQLLLKAQVYLATLDGVDLPEGFADNLLSDHPSETVFLSQVQPVLGSGRLFCLDSLDGICGICVDSGECVQLKDCHVGHLVNSGALGKEVVDLPRGCAGRVPTGVVERRYEGNDVHGIRFRSSCGSSVEDSTVCDEASVNGWVFGVELASFGEFGTGSKANKVFCTHVSDLCGTLDLVSSTSFGSIVPSVINQTSRVYAFLAEGDSSDNLFHDDVSSNLSAPRKTYGFVSRASAGNEFENSRAYAQNVFSTTDISSSDEFRRKGAIGFQSLNSECTLFRCCEAVGMKVTGENADTSSVSVGAGFMLVGDAATLDTNSVVTQSVSRCNGGGSGTAAGIYLDKTRCAIITKNEVNANGGAINNGFGYGIVDFATASDSMILQNLAYNNSKNYQVAFKQGVLPVATGTNSNVKLLRFAGLYDNILLEKAPGSEQQEPCVQSSLEVCPC